MFSANTAAGQTRLLDSLQNELRRCGATRKGELKASALLLDISRAYGTMSPENAFAYADKALKKAWALRSRELEANAYLHRGTARKNQGSLELAFRDFDSARVIAQANRFSLLEAGALNNIANIYQRQGKFEESLSIHKEALNIRTRLNDERGMINTYVNLGIVNRKLGYADVALNYYILAGHLLEKTGDEMALGNVYNNMGNIFIETKDYRRAREHLEKAAALFNKTNATGAYGKAMSNLGDVSILIGDTARSNAEYKTAASVFFAVRTAIFDAYGFNTLGKRFYNLGLMDSAVANYNRCVAIAQKVGEVELVLDALKAVATISLDRERPAEALAYADSILDFSNRSSSLLYRYEALKLKARAHSRLAQFDRAYAIASECDKVKDSLYSTSRTKRISELEIQYKVQLTQRENSLLKKQQDLDKAELARKTSELALVEKEKRVQNLLLENKTHALELQRETAVRASQRIQILEKDRNLRQVQLEKEQWLSSLWFTVVIALVLITVLLVVLHRLRKRSLAQYKEKNAELERATTEILKQQEELRRQNERLETLNIEKNEILAVAAHDLKNPIGSVLALAQLIRNPATPDTARNECLSQMEVSSRKMLSLVSNLLDIEKIDQGVHEIEVGPVDLSNVLADCIGHHVMHAEEKGISILLTTAGLHHFALADSSSLVQIADNLISNAIKFSPPSTRIFVKAFSSEESVSFQVIDNGPGFTASDMPKLFTKFARLTARPTGGEISTGLGLYIVKRLVDGQRGTIQCESEQGKGASFTVQFPSSGLLYPERKNLHPKAQFS